MQRTINSVEEAVRRHMAKQDQAHDWYHIARVRTMALHIAAAEGGDRLVVELSALVHDVGDRKMNESEEAGRKAIESMLDACDVPPYITDKVTNVACRVSFKGFGVPDDMPTLEGKIVQDADRLDAIGAIAIARTFTWGGVKGRPIYDPSEPIFLANSPDAYYGSGGVTSINHFHEKLLHLKDRLHTETARKIAVQRHEFMETFLKQFDDEWHGRV